MKSRIKEWRGLILLVILFCFLWLIPDAVRGNWEWVRAGVSGILLVAVVLTVTVLILKYREGRESS